MFEPGKKIYLIGIKGVGMTSLAQVLQTWGCLVSGSDTKQKYFTDKVLKSLGISYKEGFSARNLSHDIDLVVRSAAYDENHVEVMEAERRGTPVVIYPEAIGHVINSAERGIGIIGSHGKTTCTALIGLLLKETGLDPTVFVGSSVKQFNDNNALVGRRDLVVAELCEYRRHFLYSKPKYVLLTNIDWDHPDSLKTPDDYKRAFCLFLAQLEPDSLIVHNGDDPACIEVMNMPEIKRRFSKQVSFGFGGNNDWQAERLGVVKDKQKFKISRNNNEFATFDLSMCGEHNVINALGSFIIASHLGVGKELASAVFANFAGSKRRFEHKGTINGITIIDDYAHHPAEIVATLHGAREKFFQQKIWCVFQAHTYSRTEALLDGFAKSFKCADEVIINKIFPSARELSSLYKIDGVALAVEISKYHPSARFIADFPETAVYLQERIRPGDVVITMGAGDAYQVGDILLGKTKEKVLAK